jgi:hypothetical protein
MSEMGSHDPFGHLKHKLWPKESRESTRFPCVQVASDMSLESSRRGVQLSFRPRPNRSSAPKIIVSQSCKTHVLSDLGTPIWESQDKKNHLGVSGQKKPFGCHSGEWYKVYYMGEGGGFPRVRAVVSLESPRLFMACPSTKDVLENELTNLLVGLMHV